MPMAKDLGQALKSEQIQSVKIRRAVVVASLTTLEEVIARMERERTGCVMIEEKGSLIGIFTERDILKVIEAGLDITRTAVDRVMTRKPRCLRADDSMASAIRVMNEGGYRHIPIVDSKGGIQGVLTAKNVVSYLAEHYPYEVYNLPPDPHQTQRAPEGA